MKTKFIHRQLEKASKHLGISDSACAAIAAELQPYFKYEIAVFHQMGDGFVVFWECDDQRLAPHNITVEEVLSDIQRDKTAYLD